jgi:hypothetical protein
MAEVFHELHGDYVENAGQQISLREYLDYFEPLGSALARLPDGAGGPFVHHFTDGGGRTISALGWVVSAKSKRFGGWTLWGAWTDRPMPPVALPLFWPVLADPARVSDWVRRANEDLVDEERWSDALGELKSARLRDASFREYLKAELARAYAVPLPHRHPIEIELTPRMLDLLPWLYLLGPVDPAAARLQPNRFNGPGYQYILSDDLPTLSDAEIPPAIDQLVDAAAKSVATGWKMANDLRTRRERPATKSAKAVKPLKPRERSDMRSAPPPTEKTVKPALRVDATIVYQIIVILLLAWIGWNVHLIRKATRTAAPPAVTATTTTTAAPEEEPSTQTIAPIYEPDLSTTRLRRVANALRTRAPRGIRMGTTALNDITADKLARVSVEIFLRRNRCFTGTDAVDGKLSATEQRAIRDCASLRDARLMKDRTEPDPGRAIDWLEETVVP